MWNEYNAYNEKITQYKNKNFFDLLNHYCEENTKL